jgi:hypothetical protein
MEFLKKNYEKVLLGLVLLGLAVAVGFLPFVISSQREALQSLEDSVRPANVKPLTNLNLTVAEAALKRISSPAMIDFGPPNRLFNPMPWQKGADGQLIPVAKVGPTALIVTNITPLYLRLTLDSVSVDTSGKPSYIIGVEQPGPVGNTKKRMQVSCTMDPITKNAAKVFNMIDVKGKPDDPSEIIVELIDTNERVSISKNKPYERVEGYMADLRYDPEKKRWDDRRVGSTPLLAFNGEEYNIVAITKDEIVLSAKSNGKKWTIKAQTAQL